VLAQELGISLRTLYRDIDALKGQGAQIDGEPGIGYVLRRGFMLPPLMFTEDELEALVLGSRWFRNGPMIRLAEPREMRLLKLQPFCPMSYSKSLLPLP